MGCRYGPLMKIWSPKAVPITFTGTGKSLRYWPAYSRNSVSLTLNNRFGQALHCLSISTSNPPPVFALLSLCSPTTSLTIRFFSLPLFSYRIFTSSPRTSISLSSFFHPHPPACPSRHSVRTRRPGPALPLQAASSKDAMAAETFDGGPHGSPWKASYRVETVAVPLGWLGACKGLSSLAAPGRWAALVRLQPSGNCENGMGVEKLSLMPRASPSCGLWEDLCD